MVQRGVRRLNDRFSTHNRFPFSFFFFPFLLSSSLVSFFDTPGSVKTLEVFQSDGISSELPLEPRFTNFPEPHSLFFLLRKKKRAHDQGWQALVPTRGLHQKEPRKKIHILCCRSTTSIHLSIGVWHQSQLSHCDWRHEAKKECELR